MRLLGQKKNFPSPIGVKTQREKIPPGIQRPFFVFVPKNSTKNPRKASSFAPRQASLGLLTKNFKLDSEKTEESLTTRENRNHLLTQGRDVFGRWKKKEVPSRREQSESALDYGAKEREHSPAAAEISIGIQRFNETNLSAARKDSALFESFQLLLERLDNVLHGN